MKWMFFVIAAELSVLLCLIFAFDEALHSVASMRATWDHAAVFVLYAIGRVGFSKMRSARPLPAAHPGGLSRA
ncbi:MAG: hypothetical protein Q8O42_16355 [Acidobacteriota bacterium]|nr:hypothetical protein [Acidobacteriota bacterium]